MTNNQYNVALKSYNQAAALEQLLKTAHAAVDNFIDRMDDDERGHFQFTITINGVQTAFMFGSPQHDALLSFIEHIADEYGYIVDYDNETVTED